MNKLAAITAIIIVFILYITRQEIILIARIIVPVIALIAALLSIAASGFYLYMLREKALTIREKRLEAGREIIKMPDGQIYVREPDQHATYRALHSNPHHYINGIQSEPTELELLTFQAHLSRRQKAPMIKTPMIIEGQSSSKLDLLHIMTQNQNAYAIIGAQRSGKSTQAMSIAYHWLKRGVTPFVIGPKMMQGEWLGCNKTIASQPEQIARRLNQIRLTAISRNDSGQAHNPQPIFLDDWLWSVLNVDNARAFFEDASTILASANIICYFIMHSDNARAFSGDNKYGAMLKNNLTKLILEPIPDQSGAIIPGQSKGYIQYPNSKDKKPVDLLEPSSREELVKILARQGLDSREIAKLIYKNVGGKQIQLVEKYL